MILSILAGAMLMSANPTSSDAMLDALHSDGPNQLHTKKLMQFGRFVGSWDLDVIYYDDEGQVRRRTPGEWHFGWVLEGRAIEDVWTIPPRRDRPSSGPPPGEYGVTLRFYDPSIDAWRSTWHGPVNGIVWPFIAREVGDEMILERQSEDGSTTRWIFSQIRQDSFHWRAVKSTDGVNWQLEQEMFAKRAPGSR